MMVKFFIIFYFLFFFFDVKLGFHQIAVKQWITPIRKKADNFYASDCHKEKHMDTANILRVELNKSKSKYILQNCR